MQGEKEGEALLQAPGQAHPQRHWPVEPARGRCAGGPCRVVPDLVILRVQKKRIQRHGRRFTCSSDSLRWRPRAPTLSFTFNPDTVPEDEFEAGALHVHLRTGITHDAGTKRIELDFDDHFRFSPGAFPTCDPKDLFANSDQGPPDMADAMAQCGSAIVGTGTGQAGEPTFPVFNACVLVFNGTQSDDGLPTLLLFVRAQASPPVIDCSNPESNHAGNYTLLLQGSLGHEVPGSGYGRVLSFENMQAVPLPIIGLDLTLGRDRFVTARCGADDALRGWQMRAQLSYVKPRSEQSVSWPRCCSRSRYRPHRRWCCGELRGRATSIGAAAPADTAMTASAALWRDLGIGPADPIGMVQLCREPLQDGLHGRPCDAPPASATQDAAEARRGCAERSARGRLRAARPGRQRGHRGPGELPRPRRCSRATSRRSTTTWSGATTARSPSRPTPRGAGRSRSATEAFRAATSTRR